MRVVKNKIAPPFRNAEFEILHDRGIDFEGDVLKLALEDEVIEKSGAFFSYKDQRLGQGKENDRRSSCGRTRRSATRSSRRCWQKRKPKAGRCRRRSEAVAARDEAEAAAELAAIGARGRGPPKKKRGKAASDVQRVSERMKNDAVDRSRSAPCPRLAPRLCSSSVSRTGMFA